MRRMKCENCKKYEATRKDYRWYDDWQGSLASCDYCAALSDLWHARVHERKLNPKKVLEGSE